MMDTSYILRLLWPLLAFQLVLMVFALQDLLRRQRTRYLERWAWGLIIVVVSTIGPIAYFLLGRDDSQ